MKRQIQLKWFITLVLLSLGIVLIIGYSFLSANYFILGMDNMIASNMEQAANKYFSRATTQNKHPKKYDGYPVSQHWLGQPENILKLFNEAPEENGTLYKVENANNQKAIKGIYFVMKFNSRNQTLYISHHLSKATVSNMVHQNLIRSLDNLVIISILSMVSFSIIFWFIMRRVSRPVSALGKWTQNLNTETLTEPLPDFSYTELNDMARLIKNSLSSVQQSLNREQRFLHYTSHELRTPISIIRSNIDLMHKLQKNVLSIDDPRQQQIIDRIDRASMNMKYLTETLLWLSRDDNEELPQQTIQLDELTQQITRDTEYLLKDKAVKIELKTEPCSLSLPKVAARIVLGNLIRNAFQHTYNGTVQIHQQGNRVDINNIQNDSTQHNEDLGFGLGLQLTVQLAERLNWVYSNDTRSDHYGTTVIFCTHDDA